MEFTYKKSFSFEHRSADASKIKKKYPERVPIIVERHPNSQVEDIDKHKFLVPNDMTAGQFLYIIRKRLNLSAEKALFLFIGNTMPQSSCTMGQMYQDSVDQDGFLYATYSGENSFGL